MSDHFSGPAVMGEPAVDITDLYAFVSPERAGNLVLIMNVFPMAGAGARFSDAATYRFRVRPLVRSGKSIHHGAVEHAIDVRFDDLREGSPEQRGAITTSDGQRVSFVTGVPFEQHGMRVFAGLRSDPFFMDVEAALVTTEVAGKLAFRRPGVNTVELRDVLSIVVEVPFAPLVDRLGTTLVGAVAETLVARGGETARIERVGRPELKNFVLQNTARDPRTRGLELRDVYNREDAFALAPEPRALFESRLDANLAFFDDLDGATAWPKGEDGRHPVRELLLGDYLVVDLAYPFAPGGFLEIERAALDDRPHASAGGRWLDDDILDDLLTLLVNGARGERLGDAVDAPTKPASRSFPYMREPNERADLPLPAFLGG